MNMKGSTCGNNIYWLHPKHQKDREGNICCTSCWKPIAIHSTIYIYLFQFIPRPPRHGRLKAAFHCWALGKAALLLIWGVADCPTNHWIPPHQGRTWQKDTDSGHYKYSLVQFFRGKQNEDQLFLKNISQYNTKSQISVSGYTAVSFIDHKMWNSSFYFFKGVNGSIKHKNKIV